jgi:RHS repeat-associated protein
MRPPQCSWRRLASVAVTLLCWAGLHAQGSDTVGVPLRIWASAAYRYTGEPGELDLDVVGMPSADLPSGHLSKVWIRTNTNGPLPQVPDVSTIKLVPGKEYQVGLNAEYITNIVLFSAAPPGYSVEIAGVARSSYNVPAAGSYTGTVTLRVVPSTDLSGRAGEASSLSGGKIFWQMALGSLRNGQSAGAITLVDPGTDATWNVGTPAALQYTPPAVEISVYKAPGSPAIRQITTNQAIVDIYAVAGSTNSYKIDFYSPDQKVGTTAPYTFTGSPYINYTLTQSATAADQILQITSQTSARTAVTILKRTGDGLTPAYSWNVQDWNTSGASQLVEEQRDSTGTAANRTENRYLRTPSQAAAVSVANSFQQFNWGEELVDATAGTTNAVTNHYEYYADSAQKGSYAFPKSRFTTGGSWEAYDYDNSNVAAIGIIKTVYHPYGNTPATPTFDSSQGEVTSLGYSYDAFGMLTRPASSLTTVNGTTTAKSATTYTDAAYPGSNTLFIVTATRDDYTADGASLRSVTKYFREDAGAYFDPNTFEYHPDQDYYRGLPYSQQTPAGVKVSFAYHRGDFNETTHAFTLNTTGGGSRTTTITGSASTGSALSDCDGFVIDQVYLVDGKSTMSVSIRDARALVRRTETYARIGGTWKSIGSADLTYDSAGHVTGSTASNGMVTTINYDGDQVSSQIDGAGIEMDYDYDAAGRVNTVTKIAVANVVANLVTKFVYDAASHVRQQTTGAPGFETNSALETLVSRSIYDDAGRVTSETKPGPNGGTSTGYSYDPANRQVTVTSPTGATRTEAYQVDGALSAVSGTAVIPEFYAYDVDGTGIRHARVNIGTLSSTRLRETWVDWAGRTAKTSHPGFTGQPAFVEKATYDSSNGQLTQTSRVDGSAGARVVADTLYSYDVMGTVSSSGLDLDGNGSLSTATADRVAAADQYFESDSNSVLWLTKQTKTYPTAGGGTPLVTSTQRQRFSGLGGTYSPATGISGTKVSEEMLTDVSGNTITRITIVDRAAVTTTIATTSSGLGQTDLQTVIAGLATKVQRFDGLIYQTGYDALHRPNTSTDPRTGTATTYYKPGSTFVWYVKDAVAPTPNTVVTYTYDNAGRVIATTDAAGNVKRVDYNLRNQVVHQWGTGTYAVEYGYDAFGQQVTLRTFRGGSGWDGSDWPGTGTNPSANPGTGDWTRWVYDAPSGLLKEKYDAANLSGAGDPIASAKKVAYTYNARGQILTRTLARGTTTTTTYHYFGDSDVGGYLTGELQGMTYADSTPAVSYTYTRAGQMDTVTDGVTGLRTFVYNATNPLQLDALDLGAFYANRVQTRNYDGVHRSAGFSLGTTSALTGDLNQTYTYNTLGRFDHVTTASAIQTTSREFDYTYNTGGLVSGLGIPGSNFAISYDYEAHRNLLMTIDSKWAGTSRTRYDYVANALGQRYTAKQSGDVFGDFGGSTYYRYLYNQRGELTSAADYLGETPTTLDDAPDGTAQLPGRNFAYGYDGLGNRTSVSRTGTVGTDAYTMDAAHGPLNQYSSRTNGYAYTAGTVGSGSVTVGVADAGGPWPVNTRGRYWASQAGRQSGAGPTRTALTVTATHAGAGQSGADLVRTESRFAFVAPFTQNFTYDDDGNLSSDGIWNYVYDAENRLIQMTTTNAAMNANFADRTVEFKYDYLGRRVQKRSLNATTGSETWRRYLYDGNNLVAEFNAPGGTSCGDILRSYTWGLDMAGSLTATGGVGALVQLTDHTTNAIYFPTYDGNGNVAALLGADGAVAAKYEYSPFGELLRCEGSYAQSNPFRFSTKFTDDESGLVYYGARYYSPSLGRFINRDPIEEGGGLNLYGFCGNDAINHWDYFGNSWLSKQLGSIGRWINKNKQVIIAVVAVVASIVTYGAASAWASTWLAGSATSMGAAWSATTVSAIAGGIGGAAAGFVGGAMSTALNGGNLGQVASSGLRGAAAGAIMGSVAGYYGNSWTQPLQRIGATTVGGGLASEVSGGSFRDGALISGGIALVTYGALKMREFTTAQSRLDPRNATKDSVGFNGDNVGNGGGRWDPRREALGLAQEESAMGNLQGAKGSISIFGWKIPYERGDFLDRVVEAYSGVHDWFNNPWGYAQENHPGYFGKVDVLAGDYVPELSPFGSRLQSLGISSRGVASVMNWVNVPLTTPIVATSVLGVYDPVYIRGFYGKR